MVNAMTESNHLIGTIRKTALIFALPPETAEATSERIGGLLAEGKRVFSVHCQRPETVDRIAAAATAAGDAALIGACGVTDSNTARAAILSGADFISTPYLDMNTVRLCHRYAKVCIPGALSVTEVLQAIESGCGLVGLYPAQLFGPKLLKAVKGPLPQANLVPCGGIEEPDALQWLQAGAAAVEVTLAAGPPAAGR